MAKSRVHALLSVDVLRASDVPSLDRIGKSDPFVVVGLGSRTFRTPHVENSANPEWNARIVTLLLSHERSIVVTFSLYDYDKVDSSDFIGRAELSLEGHPLDETVTHTLMLQCDTKAKKGGGSTTPVIIVQIHLASHVGLYRRFWKHVFLMADVDRSGHLDRTELEAALAMIGGESVLPPSAVEALLSSAASGRLDPDTFAAKAVATEAGLTVPPNLEIIREAERCAEQLDADLNLSDDEDVIWFVGLALWQRPDSLTQIILSESGCLTDRDAAKGKEGRFLGRLRVFAGGEERKKKLGDDEGIEILVMERYTHKPLKEKIPNYLKVGMRLMYGGGHVAERLSTTLKLLRKMTVGAREKYDGAESAKGIEEFVAYHEINMAEADLSSVASYPTFNAFFYRKLRAGARPIASPWDGRVAVSPADCRSLVFPTIESSRLLWIKGRHFGVSELLRNPALADLYENGSLVISRLAPQDYHRFHFATDGVASEIGPVISGEFYTVNPIAVRSAIDVYTENQRQVVVVESEEFGVVTHVAVGATMVGSINLTFKRGQSICKGDEMGYFAFGGSTILTLFQPQAISFDDDLLINSNKPIETLVKQGQSLGTATGKAHAAVFQNVPAARSAKVIEGIKDRFDVEQTAYDASLEAVVAAFPSRKLLLSAVAAGPFTIDGSSYTAEPVFDYSRPASVAAKAATAIASAIAPESTHTDQRRQLAYLSLLK